MAQEFKIMVAFFNAKGGVGKSTLATQIAAGMQIAGLKVCFYDLDPQGTSKNYLSKISPTYKPSQIETDIDVKPNDDITAIVLDCPPDLSFTPTKNFLIVAPTSSSSLDLHSYRKVLELEQEGYKVIKVINYFSFMRKQDQELKNQFGEAVMISNNTSIEFAMANYKTIFNHKHPSIKKAINQFTHLFKCIMDKKASNLTQDEFMYLGLTGAINEKELEKKKSQTIKK